MREWRHRQLEKAPGLLPYNKKDFTRRFISEVPNVAEKTVSIIVPCYKVEKYLPRCLDSLVNQTQPNIEVICINDGSPDACIDILRGYEHDYPDTVVVIDKENEGVWRGRWDGIRIARGEYIGFIDSDDYAAPNFVESLYAVAKKNDAVLSVGGFERVDLDTGKVLSTEMCQPRPDFVIEDEPGRLVELNGAPWNKLFRADILKNMRDLDNPPAVLDDLVFHLLAYLDMKGTVAFTPECLVHYMVRSDSIINTITPEKLQTGYDAFLTVENYYTEAGASNELMQALDAMAFLHLGVSMLYRESCYKDVNLGASVNRCTEFLDANFPTWKNSPYINSAYAKKNGGAFKKLLFAQRMYKAHLMGPLLACYRFLIDRLKIDVKW